MSMPGRNCATFQMHRRKIIPAGKCKGIAGAAPCGNASPEGKANPPLFRKEKRGDILCFADKFLSAFGAGNGDFAFTLGNPHLLAAFGAGKIAMVTVFRATQQIQKAPVFPIPPIGLPGEGAIQCPDHTPIGQQPQNGSDPPIKKQGHQQGNYARPQYHGIELIGAVATGHEAPQPRFDFFSQPTQPAAEILHI